MRTTAAVLVGILIGASAVPLWTVADEVWCRTCPPYPTVVVDPPDDQTLPVSVQPQVDDRGMIIADCRRLSGEALETIKHRPFKDPLWDDAK